MKTKISIAIASHLSDAQYLMSCDKELANKKINFAKLLLFRFPNTDEEVENVHLDELWNIL